jgi:6-pyruvoyl-tetrahydropterin synthase
VEELQRPVVWPTGVGGPQLQLLHWQVRPTAENIAMWIAGWLAEKVEHTGPGAVLVALELRESPNLAAVVRGVDIETCKGYPGR